MASQLKTSLENASQKRSDGENPSESHAVAGSHDNFSQPSGLDDTSDNTSQASDGNADGEVSARMFVFVSQVSVDVVDRASMQREPASQLERGIRPEGHGARQP